MFVNRGELSGGFRTFLGPGLGGLFGVLGQVFPVVFTVVCVLRCICGSGSIGILGLVG